MLPRRRDGDCRDASVALHYSQAPKSSLSLAFTVSRGRVPPAAMPKPNGLTQYQRILELIEEPFGPYRDEDLLSASCKSTNQSLLELHNVMLEYGGRATGYV
ncbi:hypothetical protein EVG20_g11619 [Dentipellis fragilis]|uniref:Uncharacterized protein n=1 Tax=Dentipellis fragilis TaxID=205917 RepID=A0A4Y9XP14_9AGAM|nr:hypothetical protein EVG20_g11619 [Dentipellis fragilis]